MPMQTPASGGDQRVTELTPDMLDKLTAKVYALLLRDLRIARERFRGVDKSKARTARGGW